MTIKICGITNLADAEAAANAGADFIGLIRAASPRAIEAGAARQIVEKFRDRLPAPVLLFRDAPLESVIAELRDLPAPYVQLHGAETPEYVRSLRERGVGIRIIKAWEIGPPESEAALHAFVSELSVSDPAALAAVIVDAPKGGSHPGVARLRALAASWPRDFPPLWCAGALTPENVGATIKGSAFAGVDVARGVEIRPGEKDARRMQAFVAAVRAVSPTDAR